MQKSYALFDFDGTLRKGDSIVSLCLYARRRKLCTTGQLLKGIAYAAGYGLHLCSAERAKAASLCWMKGRLVPEVEAFSKLGSEERHAFLGLMHSFTALLAGSVGAIEGEGEEK